jgi:Insulinase (Peptidase family M16)
VTDAAVTMDFYPQPGPGRAKHWTFPVPERGALASGLAVLRCHRPGQQVVAVEIGLDIPLDAEPDGLDGIATIMARALSQGTATHTAEEFTAEMERCGATLDAHADHLGMRVSLEVPASRLPRPGREPPRPPPRSSLRSRRTTWPRSWSATHPRSRLR